MKKTYEKPTAEVISFQLNEDLTVDGKPGVSTAPPGLWESLDSDNGYTIVD